LVGVIHDAAHSADRNQRRNAALVPEQHPYNASLNEVGSRFPPIRGLQGPCCRPPLPRRGRAYRGGYPVASHSAYFPAVQSS
jgi:hypothetical protein